MLQMHYFSDWDEVVSSLLFVILSLPSVEVWLWWTEISRCNNVLRKIWSLPHNSHTSNLSVHSVGQTASVYNIIYNRFYNLISSTLSYPSSLISTIFNDSCHNGKLNFIGYTIDYLFGASHCKSYSADHSAIGSLIREIHSPHTVIPNFSHDELNAIVSHNIF